jgi:DNA mismatch endonuclease Vsr
VPGAEGRGRWNDRLPDDRAYKRRVGAVTPALEQDRAAGGRNRRCVDLGDGRFARASITLRVYRRTRRVRAYLRWSRDGKTEECYVCEVEHDSRKKNLAEAWRHARQNGLATDEPLPHGSKASSSAVHAVMRANRGKNTGPELALRGCLHRRGLRYLVNANPLDEGRTTADVVFPRDQVAVFLDGCFWHGCPEHYRPATRNADFWDKKISGNRTRDTRTTEKLMAAGWTVVRIWEHDDPVQAAENIERLIRGLRAGPK